MRKIGVVTVNRSDYGLYRPILTKLKENSQIKTLLFIAGSHLSREHGLSIQEIKKDKFQITSQIKLKLGNNSPVGVSQTLAQAVSGFAKNFFKYRPDLLLILGDRFEMFAAAAGEFSSCDIGSA